MFADNSDLLKSVQTSLHFIQVTVTLHSLYESLNSLNYFTSVHYSKI